MIELYATLPAAEFNSAVNRPFLDLFGYALV